MLRNYLKIAWRNILKSKIFSSINIFGLSIGLACCMLISLYIFNEFQYDTYHKDINQLYQIGTTFIQSGKKDNTPNTPALMGQTMMQEFPEITMQTKLLGLFAEDKTLIQYADGKAGLRSFYESEGYLADSTFFKMFTYNFINGDPNSALSDPNSIVLNEELSHKIFGNENAINKVLKISSSTNGDRIYKVTGVFRPYSKPSHINAKFFLTLKGGGIDNYIKENGKDLATNNMFFTYIKLKEGTGANKLESKFPAFIDKYAGKDLRAKGFYKSQFLIPVKDIHLNSLVPKNVTPSGSKIYLYILGSIALFTLLLACINFMNLSTARSSKRSAEVGIRKVMGAEKGSLIRQFLGESLLMSLIAFILALAITLLLKPLFEQVANKHIEFSLSDLLMIIPSFLLLSVITGLIAGSYPAFYLSSFKPVKVLKSKFSNSFAAVSLRKTLVVFQFIISVILIIASLVINNQMKYLRSKDLGFSKGQQIIIPFRSEGAKKMYASLKNEITRDNNVASVGATFYYPGIFNASDNGFYKDGQTVNDSRRARINTVDDNFLQTLGITPVAGRLFSPEFPSDSINKMIINETGAKEIGFSSPKEAVGKNIYFEYNGKKISNEIIGVVKDFHFEDLHLSITPYVFQLNNRQSYNYLLVHAKTVQNDKLLASLGQIWHSLNPNEPFSFSFLDEDFQKNYQAENRLSSIVSYFTIIAIFISCLGLLGLAIFSAEQRTKEIGIRKVLGASVMSIVTLLSRDFLKLVIISVVIASPLAWMIMNKWLQDFAYKSPISWTIFVLTFVTALLIALLTISFNAIRAAVSNPINNLRTE